MKTINSMNKDELKALLNETVDKINKNDQQDERKLNGLTGL